MLFSIKLNEEKMPYYFIFYFLKKSLIRKEAKNYVGSTLQVSHEGWNIKVEQHMLILIFEG